MALALILAVLIGLSLSVLGSGGSIITVPVLVYAAGQTSQDAIPMSLAIVGAVSALGTVHKARSGLVHWQAVGAFGIAGMLGAALGAQGTRLVPPHVLLLLFAILMVVVAVKMWRRPQRTVEQATECRPVRCLAAGFGVGLLTGFLGVGGGFLLVPALAHFALLATPMAIGTSLAIIALNSLGGLLGHWQTAGAHWQLTLLFLLAAAAGMLAGLPLAKRISAGALNRGFAVFIFVIGLFVIGRNLFAAHLRQPSTRTRNERPEKDKRPDHRRRTTNRGRHRATKERRLPHDREPADGGRGRSADEPGRRAPGS